MPFQKGHPRFPPRDGESARQARAAREKHERLYEPIESVPDGLTWKPSPGWSNTTTTLYSIGNIYKLVRVRDTGAVTYFKLKGSDVPKSPAEKIDAEPKKERKRLDVGSRCWFVDTGPHWYLVEIVARAPNRVTIKSVTGVDADKLAPWPHSELLEFPVHSPLFQRLRKLSARYV